VPRSDANLTRLSWWGRLVLAGSAAFPVYLGIRQYVSVEASIGRAVEITLWSLLLFWGLLGAKFLLALPWLNRLDAAATFEEQALSAKD
jgi:hypothetical protein